MAANKILSLVLLLTMTLFAELQIGSLSHSRSSNSNSSRYNETFVRSSQLFLGGTSRASGSLEESIVQEDTLVFPLFEDLTVKAKKDSVYHLPNGTLVWRGSNVYGEDGYTQFIISNGILAGSVYSSDMVYHLSGQSASVVEVTELNPGKIPVDPEHSCTGDHDHESRDMDELEEIVQAKSRAGSDPVIDVIVLYHQELLNQFGSVAAMEAEIELRVEEANTVMENSLISARLRLVHHAVATDLDNNPNGVGMIENSVQANALRDQYGGDLVSYWNTGSQNGQGSMEGFASVAPYWMVSGRYSFVHEVGHNFGAGHDRYSEGAVGRGGRYSYGFNIDYNNGSSVARTVMTYTNYCQDVYGATSYSQCPQWPYFSNPNVSVNEWWGSVDAVGVPEGDANAAYNAKTIEEFAPTVESWKTSKVDVTTYALTVNGGAGSGNYEASASIAIAAIDSTSFGRQFSHWTGDTQILNNSSSMTATVTMPSSNATVTAVYVDITNETFTLTVENGSGDGTYTKGTQVSIAADDIAGKIFAGWSGDTTDLGLDGELATITMPGADITITALYKDEPSLDTSNLSENLVSLFYWETIQDEYGSETTIDTGNHYSDEKVSADIMLIADNASANEYSWGKLSAYFDSTMNSVTVVKLTYSATDPVQFILEQELLSDAGVAYTYTVPATNGSEATVYLAIDQFTQPSWEGSLEADLDLSKVSSISFQPAEKEKTVSLTVSELRFTNFEYERQAVALSPLAAAGGSLGVLSTSAEKVSLAVPHSGTYRIMLYSLSGRIVLDRTLSLQEGVAQFPVQNMNGGLYLLGITGNGENLVQKVVIR